MQSSACSSVVDWVNLCNEGRATFFFPHVVFSAKSFAGSTDTRCPYLFLSNSRKSILPWDSRKNSLPTMKFNFGFSNVRQILRGLENQRSTLTECSFNAGCSRDLLTSDSCRKLISIEQQQNSFHLSSGQVSMQEDYHIETFEDGCVYACMFCDI